MRVTTAERQLLQMIRSGAPFAIMIMLKEAGGEWAVSTGSPPFEDVTRASAGCGFSFDDAWRSRVKPFGGDVYTRRLI